MEKLDYIESETKANAAFHLACCEALAKESNNFLMFILAGAGAALGYAINLLGGDAPTEKLDYIESETKANAAFHLACCEALAKESNNFLMFILAGAGAALGYAINLLGGDAPTWQLYGMGAVSAYLFTVAALATLKCLWAGEIYPPANEPKNLNQPDCEVEAIRRAELSNRQACIDFNRERNDGVGLWLNRCRVLASATPLVFVIAAWVSCL